MLPSSLSPGAYLPARANAELDFRAPLQRGSTGMAVKRVQEWLGLQGHGVDIDSEFGPATFSAVGDFQAAAGLGRTGIVDQPTWEALVDPAVRALDPIPAAAHGFGSLAVAYALQHLNFRPLESGGDNCGPWVRLYLGWDGTDAKWCAGFVCFALEQAAQGLKLPLPIQSSSSCTTLAERAKRIGKLVTPHAPPPVGALPPGSLFLVRKATDVWEHVGLIEAATPNALRTIEGNTDHNGSSNGYEATRRTRGYAGKDFIVW